MTDAPAARARLAASAVRAVNRLSRAAGRGSGTVIGGRTGLALCPDLLAQLARGRETIVVSGTNGKTTTTALVAGGWGAEVATNSTGANMPAGHVAALAASRAPRAALEADEAWLPEVVRRLAPDVVILLNLSRDQLDRASEVRQIAERWRRCFADPITRDVVLVANANDPLVVYAVGDAPRVRWCDVPTPWRGDALSCPACTRPLAFRGVHWECECGFARPRDVSTTLREGLVVDGVAAQLDLSIPGDFNRANAALAVTALVAVGVEVARAVEGVNAVASVAGRFARRRWRQRSVRLALAKNPAGFAAVLAMVADASEDLWIAINARVADGKDPSWLYDVPFESLRGRRVWCWGERRLDLAARLEYAGVEATVVDDPGTVATGGDVWLLANYTAFREWTEATTPW